MAVVTQGEPEKLRLGKVINTAVSFMGRNLILSLVVGALFFVLPLILVDLWTFWFWSKLPFLGKAYFGGRWDTLARAGVALASGLLSFVPKVLGFAVLSRAAIDDIRGDRPSVGGCIQQAMRHDLPIVGTGFAIYLGFFFLSYAVSRTGLLTPSEGVAVFAVLATLCIFWGLGISAALPVAVHEGLGLRASMSRSRVLTKGHRWPIFGLFLIVIVFLLARQVGLALAFVFAMTVVGSVSSYMVITIPVAIVSAIIWVATSVVITATYTELRHIKEGSSVEDLAEIFS